MIVWTDLSAIVFIKPLFEINLFEVLKISINVFIWTIISIAELIVILGSDTGTYFINSAHHYKILLNLQLYIVFLHANSIFELGLQPYTSNRPSSARGFAPSPISQTLQFRQIMYFFYFSQFYNSVPTFWHTSVYCWAFICFDTFFFCARLMYLLTVNGVVWWIIDSVYKINM